MPGTTAAQYKTLGGRTAIDKILDLDESNDQSRQINNKFIRQSGPVRPEGIYGQGMQYNGPENTNQQRMTQNMISSINQADPRYAAHQSTMQGGQGQGQGQGQAGHYGEQQVVEDYKQISITEVANSVFPSTSHYISALDDGEHPLHAVAAGLLGSSTTLSSDKTIYIIIIIILSIAIACLLYKLNQKS